MSKLSALAVLFVLLSASTGKADDAPLEQALWERVESEDTTAVMEFYLELFPDGQHASEVLKRWVELTHRGDWDAVPKPPQEDPDQMI